MPQFGFIDLFTVLTYVVLIATALLVLDDLFIDAVAIIKRLKPREISVQVLKRMQRSPQKHIAIMIANWKEADVIGPMIRGNVRGVEYQNYTFFLGVYPNDTATWEAASKLEKLFPEKVVVVVNSQPGPTSKGQMLNQIARQVLALEEATRKRVDLFLMQDSEDVLHPQALTLLNYYSQEADFIQIPVFSFDVPKTSLVAGVYVDEFSEAHTKDLLVRQYLGAAIPSAGVGTCLSRDLVVEMRLRQEGCFLKEDTLTEDYHLGLMTKPMGFQSQFICAQLVHEDGRREFVATREYFPSKFMASVRQKSRWTLGIAYQGFTNIQWGGDLVDRYFLMRDRKGPFCSVLTVLSLLVLLGLIAIRLTQGELPSGLQNRMFSILLIFNTVAMVWRLVQRMRSVYRVNGIAQMWMVPVRWLVANMVNAMACYRAHRIYRESQRTGARPAWVKTEHQMPAHFGAEVEVQSQ